MPDQSQPRQSCSACGQALPDRHVADFDWWVKNGLRIHYTDAGGYVHLQELDGDPDFAVSPEFAIAIGEALLSCGREVLNRRRPVDA